MTSADILEALRARWPASEYLSIEEAPEDSMRQGRKIDLLVVSLWRSRGHTLDAVEIKVSLADWRRELKRGAKADWWWQHTDRFWVAVPHEIAARVRDELPSTWGLLSVKDGKARAIVLAPVHKPKAIPWPSMVGVLRATSGMSANALARAREAGRAQGVEQGRERAARDSGAAALDELRTRVNEVEVATGLPLSHWNYQDGKVFGYDRDDFLAALSMLVRGKREIERGQAAMTNAERMLRRGADALAALMEEA